MKIFKALPNESFRKCYKNIPNQQQIQLARLFIAIHKPLVHKSFFYSVPLKRSSDSTFISPQLASVNKSIQMNILFTSILALAFPLDSQQQKFATRMPETAADGVKTIKFQFQK